MPESNALVEKRQQFQAKQKELGEVFTLAKDGETYDFNRPAVLEKLGAPNSKDAIEKVKARNVELDVLGSELRQAELKEVQQSIADRDNERAQPVRAGMEHPRNDSGEVKSFGQLYIESKAFSEGWVKNRQTQMAEIDIDMKTLFQTTAGYAPQSIRSGLVVEAVTRPIQLLDLVPMRQINQPLDKYMEETTRVHSAAEKAEGATFPESQFAYTERSNPVQKIPDSIPVTDEQLEDAPEIAAILDQRLRFGLRQRLDQQIWNGDGIAPNLKGILTYAIGTQAKGADPIFDAVFKAMMQVIVTGRASPNFGAMHPTDWQTVRLMRTADGLYIMGNPSEPGPRTLFGLPIALVDAGAAGTAVVGDAANFCYVGERRGVEVQVGYSGTQFVEGKKTIRADLRAVFTLTRPSAFVKITGI